MAEKGLPPYVRWEMRAVEDREATLKEGEFRARDVLYALITPMGSKDCVERVASEWFDMLKVQVQDGRFPAEWLEQFQKAAAAFEVNETLPVEGHPIANWAMLSKAQAKTLTHFGVLTIEALAQANEEVKSRIGMNANSIVSAAKDYLAQKENSGKVVGELTSLRSANQALEANNKNLEDQLEKLKTQVEALAKKAA